MAYAEEHASAASAISRQHQLKRWRQEKKEVIRNDGVALRSLGRRVMNSMAQFTWRDLLHRSELINTVTRTVTRSCP